MNIYASYRFKRRLNKLVKKRSDLAKKIDVKLKILKESPSSSSLRLHKLSSRSEDEWSISVGRNIRIILKFVSDGIMLVDIGSHDEVY